jgi:hypothetical protein
MSNATLSFGVAGPTQDWTVEVAISEANSQRILGYLMAGTSYGTVAEGDTTRPATAEEAAQGFANGILRGLLDQTTSFERSVAAAAAAAAIAPIEPE